MPVGSLLGGIIGAGGAAAAGSASAAAGEKAYQKSSDWAKQIRAFASPWIVTGQGAQDELSQLYGLGRLSATGDTYNNSQLDQSTRAQDQQNALARFKTSPGYQFRVQEGTNALDRSAASRGMVLSGAQTKGINDYGQNMASNEYGNYTNGLAGLSGQGLNANNQSSATGAQLMGQGIQSQFQGGMAQASSYQNSANALANGIGGAINSIGTLYGMSGGFGGFGGGGGMGAAGTPGSSYYGPVYSGY